MPICGTGRRGRGLAAFALAAALAVTVVGVPLAVPASSAVADADPNAGSAGAAEASALAATSGDRVEVLSERGERQQVFALPGGGFTMEQSSEVRRVLLAGVWADVDTTLRASADGTFRPVAAGIDLALSGGGGAPLVKIGDSGASIALTFPVPLPVPALQGDTATYAEVLPGVDLEVRAHPESFTEVLVVKTPEAARQPALRTLRFGTAVSGGRLAAQPDGGFALLDGAGRVVLDSPQPRMWDSNSTDTPPGGPADPTPPAPGDRISEATGAPADQHAPAEGDTVAPMVATLTPGAVELKPPDAVLTDPTLTYPLYIDPAVAAGRPRWAMVNRTYPTATYNNWTDADQGVGYNSYSGINLKRLFWQFDIKDFGGAHVFDAKFSAFETFAATCNQSGASLWLTGALPASPTWNAQPSLSVKLNTQTLAAGRPDCNPGGKLVTWDATSAVASAAESSLSTVTVGLLADNETTNDGWKRFKNDATLEVTFDHLPNTPGAGDLAIVSGSLTLPCATGPGRPVVGSPPNLQALLTDKDNADQLFATFAWTRAGVSGQTTQNSAVVSNAAKATVPLASSAEGVYSWQARGVDLAGLFSPYSPSCQFEVDSTRPTAAASVSSVEYPENADGGGINRQGWFAFGSSGVGDVARYAYAFDGAAEKTYPATSLGGTSTVPFTPTTAGPHSVLVSSLDRAGNRGPSTTYKFFARSPDGPSRQWEFDTDPAATAARDTAGGTDATFTGTSDVTRVASNRPDSDGAVRPADQVLALNGIGSCAATATPAVQTSTSFTVATQVKISGLAVGADGLPTGPTGVQQVLSQDGTGDSALILGYDGSRSGFLLSVRTAAGMTTVLATPAATAAAVRTSSVNSAGWVSMVGVHDGAAGQLQLYLNGAPQASVGLTQLPPAVGGFRIGCGQVRPERLAGQVDDVRVWAQALPPATVRAVATETTPTAAAAADPRNGRLSSGATLAAGQHLPSPDHSQDLWMKPDGNLLLSGPAGARWASNTSSPANAGSSAVMDANGTLTLVNTAGARVALRPAAPASSSLTIGNTGGLELRRADGVLVSTTLRPAVLAPSGRLDGGQEMQSPSGMHHLIMQTDGNLVLYGPGRYLWALSDQPNAAPVPGSFLLMQADGNLVVYAPDGRVTFAVYGRAGAFLAQQDDANLVLYGPTSGGAASAIWATNTFMSFP